jgi:hypothetical protein
MYKKDLSLTDIFKNHSIKDLNKSEAYQWFKTDNVLPAKKYKVLARYSYEQNPGLSAYVEKEEEPILNYLYAYYSLDSNSWFLAENNFPVEPPREWSFYCKEYTDTNND